MNTDFGVAIAKGNVAAVDTVAEKNGTGFSVSEAGLFLAHSTAIGNGIGVSIPPNASATSFGDNHISGNGTDVKGTLTKIGTQ